MRTLNALLRAAVLLVALPVQAANWQDLPDSVQLEKMGDSLRMNGTPMTVRSFHTGAKLDTVLREVEIAWERHPGKEQVKRTEMPGWTVLNQKVGDDHRSLQVRQNGDQVEGIVALTSPKQTRPTKLAVRLAPQMTALQIVDSVDGAKVSQQITAVSARSFEVTASALEAALKADGWERHVFKKQANGIALSANRGQSQFDAMIMAQKAGALVLINTVQ